MLHFFRDVKQTLGVAHQNWNLKVEETNCSVSYKTIKEITIQFLLLLCLGVCWVFLWSTQVCYSGVLLPVPPGLLERVWPTWATSRSGRNVKTSCSSESCGFSQVVATDQSTKQPKDSSNLASGLIQPWALNFQRSSVNQGHIALHPTKLN